MTLLSVAQSGGGDEERAECDYAIARNGTVECAMQRRFLVRVAGNYAALQRCRKTLFESCHVQSAWGFAFQAAKMPGIDRPGERGEDGFDILVGECTENSVRASWNRMRGEPCRECARGLRVVRDVHDQLDRPGKTLQACRNPRITHTLRNRGRIPAQSITQRKQCGNGRRCVADLAGRDQARLGQYDCLGRRIAAIGLCSGPALPTPAIELCLAMEITAGDAQ